MKTVLLPRELNSPYDPPKNSKQVLVKYGPDEYDVLCYDPEEGEWIDTLAGDPVFFEKEDALDSIQGWAAIKQQ